MRGLLCCVLASTKERADEDLCWTGRITEGDFDLYRG